MEEADNPVLNLVACLSRAFDSLDSAEIKVPEGCRVVWHGEHLLILSKDESMEVRLNVPENVTISPRVAEGPMEIRVHVEREEEPERGLEDRLLSAVREFRRRLRELSVSTSRREEAPSEVAIPPIFEVDSPTLLELEYSMGRISYVFGRTELKRALFALALAKTATVCAARNAVSSPTNLVEEVEADTVVSPYLRVGREIVELDAIPANRVISLKKIPEDVKVWWLNWKYLPRVMAWGVDGITAEIGWRSSDLAVGYVDIQSSLYAHFLSALLNVPLFDFSYMWFLQRRTKRSKRKLWKDEKGECHYVFWTQMEAFEKLGVEDVILLCTREECEGWVTECVREDTDVRVVEVFEEDTRRMGLRVEELALTLGEEIHDRHPVTPEHPRIPSQLGSAPELPVSLDTYLTVAKMAEERILPIISSE
ncbi:hypothetical protein [Methanopyrus kandleri]|uniref:Uncharacterized protein specific for M.kandleri, MK-21 family n=2 Tax=Methanopyrus kandleri TaxID=2320 RepID=Q8TWU4_METKA|nr:hypothetical protein [Methanopyrus kandleri]AAM02150.1 Uncharacterized protein specific for M.kandleri, MK-21 family [Methanopyrus kandleri AV19]HII69833.1 hypothetical protein [Methanopyrus kandleri]